MTQRIVIGLLCAGLGAAVAVLAVQESPQEIASRTDVRSSPMEQQRAMERALAGVVAELAAIRKQLRALPVTAAAERAAAPGRAPPPRGDDPSSPAGDDGKLPAVNFDHLESLRGFRMDADVRRRWMFLGDDEALAYFGAPDLVWVTQSGAEQWKYVDGEGALKFTLEFHRGRLVTVYHSNRN